MKLILIKTIVLLLIFGYSCKKTDKDDKLSLELNNYNTNEILIDGYYYTVLENFEGVIYNRFAFYRNGIVRYLGSTKSLQEINFGPVDAKDAWGVFQIYSNEIKFEKWYPSSGGPLKAYIRAGNILNDTTFVITESYRMHKGKKTEEKVRNETYHFRQFSPKPDSTNSFIK